MVTTIYLVANDGDSGEAFATKRDAEARAEYLNARRQGNFYGVAEIGLYDGPFEAD